MKNFYLVLTILSLFSISGIVQNRVSYTYDIAGNRISRKIITISTRANSKAIIPTEDDFGEQKIIIYPNPTKGDLAVEITGGDIKDEITMFLFSIKGTLLQKKSSTVGKTTIDMSAYPAGWYILRLITGNKTTEFKIIKE